MGQNSSELIRELMNNSRQRREIVGENFDNPVTKSEEPSFSTGSNKKVLVSDKKIFTQIGKELLESNIIENSDQEEIGKSKKKVKLTDLSRKEKINLGYKFLEIELLPEESTRFKKIRPSLEQSRYKTFGNKRKLLSLLDKCDSLEKREHIRLEKFKGLLRSFSDEVARFKVEFKRPDNIRLLNEYMDKMKSGLEKLSFIYDALGFTRDELYYTMGKKDQESLAYFLKFKGMKENGKLDHLFK